MIISRREWNTGGHFELIALNDIHKIQFLIHMKDQNCVFVKSDKIQDK